MPLRDLPPQLWLLAAVVAVAVIGVALYRNLQKGERESLPPIGMLRWAPLALIAVMAVGTYFLAPAGEKAALAIAGLVLGGGLGWGFAMAPSWFFWRDDPARDLVARAAAGLGLLVLTDALVADPVMSSYVVTGGLLGLSCAALPLALSGHARAAGLSSALGLIAVIGAGVIWGDRLFPDVSIGSGWALAFAAISLGVAYAASFLPRQAAPFVTPPFLMALAAPLGYWGFHMEHPVVLPSLLGLGLALILSLLLFFSERVPEENSGPLPALTLVLVAGGCLLLANRLFGMFGVTLTGIGLSVLLLAQGRAPLLTGILVSGFAGRAFLQLFLDRTYLNQYGVDLTHTYTSFGLIAAFFVPFALAALRRTIAPSGLFLGLEALAVLLFPVLMGYFIHVDPLASYLAGLLVTVYVLGILAEEGLTTYRFAPLMPPLLLSAAALSILSAPWLITVLNVTRKERLIVFAGVVALLLVYLIALVRQRPDAPAQTA